MKTIKCSQELTQFNGEVLKDATGEVFTVGNIMANILAGQSSNPALAWQLGKKFATEKTVDLKAEEVVFLKKEVENSKTYVSLITGQILEILDSTDTSIKA